MATPTTPPTQCHPLLKGVQAALGPTLLSKIQSCRILLVGSGGIGCELLKNLALSGFRHVEVIDLDTIDVSNLNRQFLFRSHHVGMAKCVVASEAALAMVPSFASSSSDGHGDDGAGADGDDAAAPSQSEAKYIPNHGNVCDNAKFNVQYVSTFDLVLNALDNVTARRRVNRLCLAASVPLVEAGTTGYLGQVTVIDRPSQTECYECQSKPTQKVYPICTIRSTPSQPVHTIVWSKELYKLLFGLKVEESMLYEDQEEEGAEPSTYMDLVVDLRTILVPANDDKDGADANTATAAATAAAREKATAVLTALYGTEIQKQIDTGRYKTATKSPQPLSPDAIATGSTLVEAPSKRPGYKPTHVWSVEESIAEFVSCIVDGATAASSANLPNPLPEFDKDDKLAMKFVTAASNLRSYVFDIQPIQSQYETKGIAGNIIPAIATTNAIVAGLQVLQVFNILDKQIKNETDKLKEVCRYTYCLRDKTRRGYYLQPTSLPDPNPQCFVCRNATIRVTLNVDAWTLRMLLDRILKRELGFGQPSIMIGDDIVYEEGEDIDPSEYAGNAAKALSKLPAGGVAHGTVVRVEDFTQDLEVEICFDHKEDWTSNGKEGEDGGDEDKEEIERFEIGGERPRASAAAEPAETEDAETGKEESAAKVSAAAEAAAGNPGGEEKKDDGGSDKEKKEEEEEEEDDDVIEVVEAPQPAAAAASGKPLLNGVKDKAMIMDADGGASTTTKKRPLNVDAENASPEAKKAKANDEVEVIVLD